MKKVLLSMFVCITIFWLTVSSSAYLLTEKNKILVDTLTIKAEQIIFKKWENFRSPLIESIEKLSDKYSKEPKLQAILLSIMNNLTLSNKAEDPIYDILHDGLTRYYKIHLPMWYDSNKPTPVVIYLHGGGWNMRSAYVEWLAEMSDKYGFILAVPEGTGDVKLGIIRATWNGEEEEWANGEWHGSLADDVGFISKMIVKIKENFNVNDKMVYATGISNWGLMTNHLGCELSDQIAAIATVAPGAVKSDCNPQRAVSYMQIHGTADPSNPPDWSEPKWIFSDKSKSVFSKWYRRMTPYQVIDVWKGLNDCSNKTVDGYIHGDASCIVYPDCMDYSEVELCMVEGMWHTFPSGAQYLPSSLIGPVSYDISFDQIWEFFKNHSI